MLKSLEIVNEYIKDIKKSKIIRNDGLNEFSVLHLEELKLIKKELEKKEKLEFLLKEFFYLFSCIKIESSYVLICNVTNKVMEINFKSKSIIDALKRVGDNHD